MDEFEYFMYNYLSERDDFLYYGIIIAAVVMFGFQLLINEKYESKNGNNLASSMIFIFGGSIAGLFILLAINSFKLEFTLYTLVMSVITALNMIACIVCSLKALAYINLSLYSIFSMLGGMVLPFVAGILFYGEPLTAGKIVCFAVITVALCLTFQKSDTNKKGYIYYAGIFVFNGMSGVLSKIFQESEFPKTSSAGYSVLSAAATVVIAGLFLIFLRKSLPKIDKASVFQLNAYGILNKVANYLLLIALAHVPASTQYPMVTGGVMIVSTVLGFFTDKKPCVREIASVALSFAGIMALVVI